MRTRGQFSKPAPFNYQSHQSLQKFRKVPIQQRAQEVVQDIFKIKVKGEPNSKLIMAKNMPQSKEDEIKELKKHIKLIENELKKKILDNPILSRIFKTKQPTNGQMAHLDLYLEFVKLKEEKQSYEKKVEQSLEVHKQKQMTYEMQISQLKDEMQQKQQNFITQIEKASEKFEKLQKEFQKKISQKEKIFEQETIERQSKIQDNNLILEELKRKNYKLTKENKEYETKLNEYKKSEQERIKSLKAQFENYKQKTIEERASQQEDFEKNKKNFKSTEQTLKNKVSSLQNELAEKTLQIQELDRFIELEKEAFENQMQQLRSSFEKELRRVNSDHEDLILSHKEEAEREIEKLINSREGEVRQLITKYEKQIKILKEKQKENQTKIKDLQLSMVERENALKKLQEDIKKYSKQIEIENRNLKATNNFLTEEKESLTKKLSQSELKSQKLTKQVQFLSHQKNQMHSKYEKGFINTENDIKHYQSIVDELERKIYMLGNENMGLKKALQEKTNTENKVKQFHRISEETYQEKYKAIGRIQEIKHKLENYLTNDFSRGFSNNFSSNNYRSNTSVHQSPVSLTESIEELTLALDKLCDHFGSLNSSIESFRKQKQEDEREFESILNHFLDIEERQSDLQEGLINYINLRKQLNKQQTVSSGIYCGEEYLLEKKREMCQFIVQKLIQLKVIKQYSSADQAASSYRLPKEHQLRSNEMDFINDQSSNKYFLSSINNNTSNNSRKSLKNLVREQQYRSNDNFVTNDDRYDGYDSLDTTKRATIKSKILLQGNQMNFKQRKSSILKERESSKNKVPIHTKYGQRMSTEPSKCEDDIEEQSTYEIMDENVDYGNVKRREGSKQKQFNQKSQYNSVNMTANKEQLNKKYREHIKEKLMSGKGKREIGMGLSKEDIEKKYFMR